MILGGTLLSSFGASVKRWFMASKPHRLRKMPLYRYCAGFWLLLAGSTMHALAQTTVPSTAGIARVGLMPDIPAPFKLRDWRAVAVGYDRLAFDENASGEHMPLIDIQRKPNGQILEFGIPPYVGDYRADRSGKLRIIHDGIATMGSVSGHYADWNR